MNRLRKMMNPLCHGDVWLLAASVILLALFFLSEPRLALFSPPVGRIQVWKCILLFLICLIAYLGGILLKKRTGYSIIKPLWIIFLILYLYLIVSLTLLDKGLRLDSTRLQEQNLSPREYYLQWFVNFRPFQSIYTVYIRGLVDGYVNLRYTVLNLLGNLCAFMPLSVLLPAVWKLMRRWYVLLPTALMTVCAVEGLQFLMMVGSCDIDDVILNLGGAALLYGIISIPPIRRWMEQIWEGTVGNHS